MFKNSATSKVKRHIDMFNIGKIIFQFKLLRSILDIDTLTIIYYSRVGNIDIYVIFTWGATYRNHLDQLKVTQMDHKKYVRKNNRLPCRNAFLNNHIILNFKLLFIIYILKFTCRNNKY